MLIKQELYRAVLANISDGVYVCDRDRRIVYWSPGAERITGYAAGGAGLILRRRDPHARGRYRQSPMRRRMPAGGRYGRRDP